MESTRKTIVTLVFTEEEAKLLYSILKVYLNTACTEEEDFIHELEDHLYFVR